MDKDEVLKLAQKAMMNSNSISYEMLDAITAIKEALEQPAQEPVAKEKIHALKPMLEALRIKQVVSFSESQKLLAEVANKSGMLPPAFEISGNQWCALVNLAVTRFGNSTAPQRPWVGLTDDEIESALPGYRAIDALDIYHAIEARLKEKQ